MKWPLLLLLACVPAWAYPPMFQADVPDPEAVTCLYENSTAGHVEQFPVSVSIERGNSAFGYRVCLRSALDWPVGLNSVRLATRAADGRTTDYTAAVLPRPSGSVASARLHRDAAAPPPPPDPEPTMIVTEDWGAGFNSANYTVIDNAPVVSGQANGIFTVNVGYLRTAETFGPDQRVKYVIKQTDLYISAALRMSLSGSSPNAGYRITVYSGDNEVYFARGVGGSFTDIYSTPISGTWAVNDVVEATIVGTTLSLYKNGVLVHSMTDATHATGNIGFEIYQTSPGTRGIDDAEFEDLGGGGTTYNESVSETVTASDATTGTRTRVGAVTEAATGTDATSALGVWLRAVSESASATDANAGTLLRVGAISESGSAADAPTAALLRVGAVSEAASAADSQAATAALAAAAAEAASAADAVASVLVAVAAVSESGSATDAVAAGAASYDVTISEAGSAADAAAAIAVQVASLSEPLSAADAFTVTAVYGAALSEPGSAADATNWAGAVYSTDIAEAATLQEAVSAALQALVGAVEAGAASDSMSAVISAGVGIAEATAAVEAASAALSLQSAIVGQANAVDAADGAVPQVYGVDLEEQADAQMMVVATVTPDGSLVLSLVNRYRVPGFGRPYRVAAFGKPYRPH